MASVKGDKGQSVRGVARVPGFALSTYVFFLSSASDEVSMFYPVLVPLEGNQGPPVCGSRGGGKPAWSVGAGGGTEMGAQVSDPIRLCFPVCHFIASWVEKGAGELGDSGSTLRTASVSGAASPSEFVGVCVVKPGGAAAGGAGSTVGRALCREASALGAQGAGLAPLSQGVADDREAASLKCCCLCFIKY